MLWLKTNWLIILDITKTIMLGVLLIITITLLGQIGNQTEQTHVLTQQTQKLTKQTKDLSQQNNRLSKQLTASNKDIKNHIDCIISFFGLPNRQSLQISDVCHFQPSGSAQTSTPAPTVSSTTSAPTTSVQNNPTPSPAPATQSTPPPTPKNCTLDILGLHLLCP